MAEDDDYIPGDEEMPEDAPPSKGEAAATEDELAQQAQEAERSDQSSDSAFVWQKESNPLAKVVKASKSARFSLPTTAPRHNVLQSYRGLEGADGDSIFITINEVPANSVGFDPVVNMQDITGDGSTGILSIVNEVTTGTNYFLLKYKPSTDPGLLANDFAVWRQIQVTWGSGHTQDFIILVAGTEQSGYQHVAANATWDVNTRIPFDCAIGYTQNFGWAYNYNSSGNQYSIHGNHTFTKTRPVAGYDPSNVYYDAEDLNQHLYYDVFLEQNLYTQANQGSASAAMGNKANCSAAPGCFNGTAFSAVPDEGQLQAQMYEVVMVNLDGSNPPSTFWDPHNIRTAHSNLQGGTNYANYASWNDMYTGLQQTIAEPFVHAYVYSENIFPCSVGPSYTVCNDFQSPSHYLTTCEDCSGNTIPATYCNGTLPAQFTADNNCCAIQCDITASVSFVDATYGNNDAKITIDLEDPNNLGNASGAPWASGTYPDIDSWYTITIAHSAGTSLTQQNPPAGGGEHTASCTTNTTSGSEHQVTVGSSNTTIATGMQVGGTGIPANTFVGDILGGTLGAVTQFELVDASGAIVSATTAATNTLDFGTGMDHTFGLLPPCVGTEHYIITVTDDDGCVASVSVSPRESLPTYGCTDSGALNYDSTANLMCTPACCVTCEASTGLLTTGSGTGDMFININTSVTATTDSSTSDGVINASCEIISAVTPYMDFDGTETYTFTLYKLITAGTLTGATTINTTTGLTTATFGTSPNKTWSSLAWGWYAVKFQVADSTGGTQGIENCYTVEYIDLPSNVCDDATATNYNTTVTPASLRIPNNSILCTYPSGCCVLGNPSVIHSGSLGCSVALRVELDCQVGFQSTSTVGSWELNGNPIPTSGFNLGSNNSGTQQIELPHNLVTDLTGIYTVFVTVTLNNGSTCTDNYTINLSNFTVNICGCTDPLSYNYDPAATVDDNSCLYPTWHCVSGTCIQQNDQNGFAIQSDCQAICGGPALGCTDPCATNYDSNATQDDGSCLYKACLDPTAANQYWSCDCNQYKQSATINDVSCCNYPCTNGPVVATESYTNASGSSCTGSNNDGIMEINVVTANGAPTWTWKITDGTNTSTVFTDINIYTASSTSGTTASSGSVLGAGTYNAVVTDSFGCETVYPFAINVNLAQCGCTDPLATNYNSSATIDDGSCLFCACTDPMAVNYNPSATCDDGSCEYTTISNPCIPKKLSDYLESADFCLNQKGFDYLQKLKNGFADTCSIMNNWKLIFVQYLLNKNKGQGLLCLYNCGDGASPSLADTNAGLTCTSQWVSGGPTTGVNDQAHPGTSISTGEGTTVTDASLFFVFGTVIHQHDVIKMPSGHIWIKVSSGNCPNGCENPESATGNASGNWAYCNDAAQTITVSDSTNYLDNFINFVNTFCQDCKLENMGTFVSSRLAQATNESSRPQLNVSQGGINFNL